MADEILLKDVKTGTIIHVEKSQTILEAAETMKKNGISSVIALDKNTIAGIMTERDIVQKVVCFGLDPKTTKVEDVMTSPVPTIDINKTIVDAARMMRQLKVKKLLVTEGREVKGIISEHDVVELDPLLHRPEEKP
jgi:signal-transduction protein with cAMP-binding, CBS, and nucleotidyltransferase domain